MLKSNLVTFYYILVKPIIYYTLAYDSMLMCKLNQFHGH